MRTALLKWLPLVARGQSVRKLATHLLHTRELSDVIGEENGICLRGFLWLAPGLPGCDDLTRSITSVALSAYKKVPGVGPRAARVGNAAVYAFPCSGRPPRWVNSPC